LIALAYYSKRSERLENWLINNKLFWGYLKNIREKGFFKEKQMVLKYCNGVGLNFRYSIISQFFGSIEIVITPFNIYG